MKTAAPVSTLTACLLLAALPSLCLPNRADAQARGREGTKQNDPPRNDPPKSEPKRNDSPPPSAPPASSPPPRREDPPAPVYVAPARPPSNTNAPPANAPRPDVRSDNGARPNITNPPARNREEQRQNASPNKSDRPGGAGRPVFGPDPYWGVPTFAQPIWQPPYFTSYNNGWNVSSWNGPAWAQPVYIQPYILEPLGPQPVWLDPIVVTRNSSPTPQPSSGSNTRFRFDDTRWQKNWGAIDEHPAWFPDGRRIVFSSLRENNRDLYLIDLSSPGNPPTRLTQSPADDYAPVVSPNGQAIAYISERDGRPALYLLKLETRELICLVRPAGRGIGAPSFSPDGRWLAFENRFDTSSVLFRVAADGSGAIERLGSFEGTGF